MTVTGIALGGLFVGLLFAVVGAVLATDYKGAASFHAKASLRAAQPLRRIPPWRWLPARAPEQDLRLALRMDRLIGAAFLVAGVGVAVACSVPLL